MIKSIDVKSVDDFLFESRTATTPFVRLADINSELGEVSKEVLKATNYNTNCNVNLDNNDKFREEYGDLLFSVLALGVENNIDPSEALSIVLKKYNVRLKSKGHIGSGE